MGAGVEVASALAPCWKASIFSPRSCTPGLRKSQLFVSKKVPELRVVPAAKWEVAGL